MSLWLNVAAVVVALLAIVVAYIKWILTYWQRRKVPYIEPVFLFGNLEPPYKKTKSVGEELTEIYEVAKSKGCKYIGVYNLTNPNFMPLDLDLVKCIMTKDFDYFTERGLYFNEKDDPVSANLFTMGGSKWKNLRVRLSPTFSLGKMKYMFQNIVQCALVFENYLLEISGNRPIQVDPILAYYTTDVIGSCAFGLECNSFNDPASAFRDFEKKVFERTRFSHIKSLLANSFPKFAQALGIITFPPEVTAFMTKLVNDTIKYREENNIIRKDFLQLIIQLKKMDVKGNGTSLTMQEVVAQCFLFFVGGFETTSTTMAFALYELAVNQKCQEKARKEILGVMQKYDNKITYESFNELKYLTQVFDESLRKYPALATINRVCVKDYKIPNTDVVIEKGTTVVIPIKGIHYDPEYFDNPKVFDPDRFTDENKQNRHGYAYMPFGEGPRICIGLRFGTMQSIVGLACLLRSFKITLNERTKTPIEYVPTSFLSRPIGGIWLNFEKISSTK